jgi:hypothetical protein
VISSLSTIGKAVQPIRLDLQARVESNAVLRIRICSETSYSAGSGLNNSPKETNPALEPTHYSVSDIWILKKTSFNSVQIKSQTAQNYDANTNASDVPVRIYCK